MPTSFEHAGGEEALHRLSVHRGLRIIEEQRRRFVELHMAADRPSGRRRWRPADADALGPVDAIVRTIATALDSDRPDAR
jgi:hypothetical protein